MIPFKVTAKVAFDERKIAEALVDNPAAAAYLLGIAQAVTDEAQRLLRAAGGHAAPTRPSRGRRLNLPVGAITWNREADATARQIKVKDATKVYSVTSGNVENERTRVALVVANHPLSHDWEYGGQGLPAVAFMRGALGHVASRNPALTRRNPSGNPLGSVGP